jgi:polyhydroxybutyrate depolymerase
MSAGAGPSLLLAAALLASPAGPAGAAGEDRSTTGRVHSVDDPRALYHGGLGPPFPLTNRRVMHPDLETALARWRTFDGCPERPLVSETLHGHNGEPDETHTATRYAYGPCRDGSEVILWRLTGSGHVWPGGEPRHMEKILGPPTRVIDVNEEMWRFFSRHALAPSR